jgi:hypothetical protein
MIVLLVVGVVLTVVGLASWSKGGRDDVYGGLLSIVFAGFMLLKDVVPDSARPYFLASVGVALGLLIVWRYRLRRNRRAQSQPG